MNTTIQ